MDYCPLRGEFLVSDISSGRIVLVDAQSGNRELITSDEDLGSAPYSARSLQWDPERGVVTTIDYFVRSLMTYDLVAHQWSTITR